MKPDLIKCQDTMCPMRDSCKRFPPTDALFEAVFQQTPRQGPQCDMYKGDAEEQEEEFE